ncbi:TPA: tail fiber assembly protein, partial [Escherichia coli]|nr:tail fiber assembly protein [Escherichia coli]HCJ2084684.1 tail fiber assembly protein [Escherichia coli]
MTTKEITLDENGFATEAGYITVYNYDGTTREYIGSSVEYLPFGVGVPAHSCVDAPGSNKDGFAICRNADSTGWEYVADHRGEIIYSTETGES